MLFFSLACILFHTNKIIDIEILSFFSSTLKELNKNYCEMEDEIYKAMQWYCSQKPTKIGRGSAVQEQKQQTALKTLSDTITHRRQSFNLLLDKVIIQKLCILFLPLSSSPHFYLY
jgi:hypothetical protein